MGTNVASQKMLYKGKQSFLSEQMLEDRSSRPSSDKGMLLVVVKYQKFHLNMKPNFFSVRVVSRGMGSLERLWGIHPWKQKKNHQISHLLWLTLLGEGGWTRWFPEVPSNLNHTVIL